MVRPMLAVFAAWLLLSAGAFADEDKVTLTVTAIQATTEKRDGKLIPPDLRAYEKSLSKVNHNTFKKLKQARASAEMGKESKTVLTDRYTLIATPQRRDDDGRVHIAFRIEEKANDARGLNNKTIVALQFTVSAAPGANIVPDGLPLDDGALVLVITVGS